MSLEDRIYSLFLLGRPLADIAKTTGHSTAHIAHVIYDKRRLGHG